MNAGAQTMIIEMVQGGAAHMMMQGAGGGMETIMAGGQVRWLVRLLLNRFAKQQYEQSRLQNGVG